MYFAVLISRLRDVAPDAPESNGVRHLPPAPEANPPLTCGRAAIVLHTSEF